MSGPGKRGSDPVSGRHINADLAGYHIAAHADVPDVGADFVPDYEPEKEPDATMDNEQIVRKVYELAEVKDYPGFVACFTEDGTFTDESLGVTYRGPEELPTPGKVYAAAFPDMHRELYNVYLSGDDIVVVQLALQGTHEGPLEYPFGTIPATGQRMDAPCCDVFQLVDGKIQRFDCYPSGTVILSQLGVLPNLEAVLTH